jgi:hypothetical protein
VALALEQMQEVNCRSSLKTDLLAALTAPHPRTRPAFALHILVCLQPTFFHHADLLAI